MARMKATPIDDFYTPGARIREDGRVLNPVFAWRVKTPAEHYPEDDYALVSQLSEKDAFRPLSERACPFLKH